ncbi:carcinoembryonic antigen-related cell adhesion molecule 1-like [Sphaeramia orbicularis]|uniref:Carcinoembryonic antigen-related cell adhesion molecule 1-like n=1 Tax=Sphaeramia orbicularis TaxID=375764 RepID=A0A673B2Q9_9TELE|nr:carcinoembryonic antigen-related cell adhesion molecule 1-like [Sphaeramia orbicularis]
MNIILISSLLGVAAFVPGVNTSKEALKVSVSVWPPGSSIHLGESVFLQCTVKFNSSFVQLYRWFRHTPHTALSLNPRHLVSGDSYSITGVTREDTGSYWCQAEWREGNTTMVFLSEPATLGVSDHPPPSLIMVPSTRQIFQGELFTLQCPMSQRNSSSWLLKHFSEDRGPRTTDFHTDRCSSLGGAVNANKSDACVFSAVNGSCGLYWCEGPEGRSNTINITVSYGVIILKTPASPVSEGHTVDLYCQYRTVNHSHTMFFKNRAHIITNTSSSSDNIVKMTIENVTKEDEGYYMCASEDRKMESAESWLSVRRNASLDVTAASTNGTWKWIIVSCGVLILFLIPLLVWLIRRYRHQAFFPRTCCPVSKEVLPAVALPATKQDMTEVQWDLSWMEMSNLLDKQLYPSA